MISSEGDSELPYVPDLSNGDILEIFKILKRSNRSWPDIYKFIVEVTHRSDSEDPNVPVSSFTSAIKAIENKRRQLLKNPNKSTELQCFMSSKFVFPKRTKRAFAVPDAPGVVKKS